VRCAGIVLSNPLPYDLGRLSKGVDHHGVPVLLFERDDTRALAQKPDGWNDAEVGHGSS
jgi:hypothetical protein